VLFSRPSIDVLFESAADTYADRLLAVVLTGANEDGAEGARAIRRAGGVVFVQDPASALGERMPRAAIECADPQLVAPLEEIGDPAERPHGRAGLNVQAKEPVKFLIVDDLEENLLVLESLLEREGLQILKARSGREALELLLTHQIALALVDVQMPEMDGFELAELMRGAERTSHVPIIFVTAGVREQKRVFRGYDAGAVRFPVQADRPANLEAQDGDVLSATPATASAGRDLAPE